MPKSPHTPEFRAKVSQEYLDEGGSYNYLANKYNIGSTTLKEWVSRYRMYGTISSTLPSPVKTALTHLVLKSAE